mgnify:CR=1 FL=1
MKIIVLDGFALNPGDLSWDGLRSLGDVTVYERTADTEILNRAVDADILITNKTPLSAQTIAGLPTLKYIGVLATGYNVVDVNAAKERGIPVTNIPTYGTASVAQMVFSHILHLTQHVKEHSDTVYAGEWERSIDFCYWNYPLIELAGKTIGIIGFGRIGQKVAQIARAFSMKIIAYDAFSEKMDPSLAEFVDIDTVFRDSDIVSLHCPLFADTEGIVNEERLKSMRSTAFLINTSRGPLVDELALTTALNNGVIAGAGLDVVSTEPILKDNPLLMAKNCFITPHIAWATAEARGRLLDTAVSNVEDFINGTPANVVNS